MRSRALLLFLPSLLVPTAVSQVQRNQEAETGRTHGERDARAARAFPIGGQGSGAPIWISFQENAALASETAAPITVPVVLHTTHSSLPQAVAVTVADTGTGTATAGVDYTAFAPLTLTFPAGSIDGTKRTITLAPIDDALGEAGGETIQLRLQAPVGGTIAGFARFRVLLADDESAGDPVFQASEGATGVENALAYDELVALGTDTVGGGRTRARWYAWRMPAAGRWRSRRPSSRARTRTTSRSRSRASRRSARSPPRSSRTLRTSCASSRVTGPGLAFRVDADELARLRTQRTVALRDFPLPGLGNVTLALRQRELPIRPDARLVVDGREIAGGPRALAGDLTVWSGQVDGVEGSQVFLALGARFAMGHVDLPFASDGRVQVLSDGRGTARLVRESGLVALGARLPSGFCAGARTVPGRRTSAAPASGSSTAAVTFADCRLALETDWEFFQLFGSSVLATQYVTGLVAAVSERYVADVQTALSIAYLGLHTNANDGWTTQDEGGDCGQLLSEFQAAWGTSWPAQADLAHFLSGAPLVGGIANFDVLCDHAEGFGVSSELMGNIDWSSWTGAPGNSTWDFLIVAHELGHQFGALHTHDHCPPLDRCWTSCSGPPACSRGTIMSYCYGCAGGLANVDLVFHPVQADILRARVAASCLEDSVLGAGDFVQYRVRFGPSTTTGPRSAVLAFPHDAPDAQQPFRIRLSGVAN